MNGDFYVNPTVAFIKAQALSWWAYKNWTGGNEEIKGYQMHVAMKDIVLAGALYAVARRKQRAYK